MHITNRHRAEVSAIPRVDIMSRQQPHMTRRHWMRAHGHGLQHAPGSVPAELGTGVCRASEPASASTNTMGRKRPATMHSPSSVLPKVVAVVMPAKALPLLLLAEVTA